MLKLEVREAFRLARAWMPAAVPLDIGETSIVKLSRDGTENCLVEVAPPEYDESPVLAGDMTWEL